MTCQIFKFTAIKKILFLAITILLAPTIGLFAQDGEFDHKIYDLTALKSDKQKIGFYKTYLDFLNNNPNYPVKADFTGRGHVFSVHYKPKKSEVTIHDEQLNSDIERFTKAMWAYTDGQYLYFNASQGSDVMYVRSEKLERYTYINLPSPDMARTVSSSLARGVGRALGEAAGVAGAVVGLIAVGTYNPNHFLDVVNGNLYKLKEKNIKKVLAHYPDLLKRYESLTESFNGNSEAIEKLSLEFLKEYNKKYREDMMDMFPIKNQ